MSMHTTISGQDGKQYILGTDPDELARLGFQHKVWSEEAFSLWNKMGIQPGSHVLDLGCGPGFASLDLAAIVTDSGKVTGVELAPNYVGDAQIRSLSQGFSNTKFIESDFREMNLEDRSLDAAYCRWALCWVENPQPVIEKVVRALKPGGVFGAQEYIHWATAKIYPDVPEVSTILAACRAGWDQMEGEMNIGGELVERFSAAGMEIVHQKLLPKLCRPGEMAWEWPMGFFEVYSMRLIELGLLTEDDRNAFLRVRPELDNDNSFFMIGPLMTEVVGRVPED